MIDLAGLPQVLWPDHCVQGEAGANLHPGLDGSRIHHVVFKGVDRDVDSYSAFFDNGRRRATGLSDYLRQAGVAWVAIMGLATDYCVKFTALDAAALGLRTIVVEDGCRGVELQAGDVQAALREMEQAGVRIISSAALLNELENHRQ